jgi:hypothetical protein
VIIVLAMTNNHDNTCKLALRAPSCIKVIVLLGVGMMAIAFPAFAQDIEQGPDKPQGSEPLMAYNTKSAAGPVGPLCATEIEARCSHFPSGAATRNCLEARTGKLSETCRIAVESTGSDRGPGTGPVVHLCVAEIGEFCAETEHDGGQVRSCLAEHGGQLGAVCMTVLDTTASGRWH